MSKGNNFQFQYAGAYSDSAGVPVVREDIAKYISERDGVPADPDDIFLSTGASESIRVVISSCSKLAH